MGVIAKVLVTGCAGFIGSNLVEELLVKGHDVAGIDDLSTGRLENMEGMDFEFSRGSINDRGLLLKILKDADFVLHQAAIPSVPRSIANPIETNHANVDGTLNLLVCARDSGVRRVVFASSSSVYGSIEQLPVKESAPAFPISPYALSKYAGEEYCRLFNDIFGLETTSLRYFNVFGPRQNPDSQYSAVIPKFIKSMLSGKKPTIYGDGEQTRDFSHIENAVRANMLALKAGKKSCGRAYNIACGERINLNQLVEQINSVLGISIKPKYTKQRAGDVRHSQADFSQAKKFLGYAPVIYFRDGLAETIDWYKKAGE